MQGFAILKPAINPTKQRFSLFQFTFDIINAGSEGRGVATCYQSEHLALSKFL